MLAGTSATTVASAPAGAAELEAAVLVPAADVDDEVGAAAADDVDDDDDELLLPQPTTATAQTSGTAADSHVLIERIALLLIESQKTGGRIGNIAGRA
ncbi:MAG TPA: hypothetical protein VNV17_05815 [Solirubrobacteraceae bacterium]|nr:hypothetical protein [Solirubrobacteraceae bacterium]